jgi:CRISPR-associated protein (TIGR02584 family)
VSGTDPPTDEAVITGDLGPNPAPVVELVWALYSHRGLRTTSLHLVTNDHALRWFHELEDGLGQLEQVVGWKPEISVHEPPVEDERTPEESVAWNEVRWTCATEAIAAAADRPVVFGLFAGRRRSMTAGVAQTYQLLARADDLLVDVRVSDRRVEGATGFYFPEQPEPTWRDDVDPRTVDVVVAELAAPRLGDRLSDAARASWRTAMAALGTEVPGEPLPTITIAVPTAEGPIVHVNGQRLPLTPALATWYLALALARRRGDGWVATDDLSALESALHHVQTLLGQAWWHPDTRLFSSIATGDWEVERAGALKKLRSDLRARVNSFGTKQAISGLHLFRPSKRTGHHSGDQRIALDPTRIHIEGVEPVT